MGVTKLAAVAAVLLAAATPALAAGDLDLAPEGRTPRDVAVLTLNQYLGADLTPVLGATAEAFNEALLAVLRQVAANDFPARAERQAALVAAARPDLVGLQEVWRYTCQDLPPTPGACAEPSISGAFVDQLAVTLEALDAAGLDYREAATVKNFDTSEITVPLPGGGSVQGLPFAIGGRNALLVAVDRDVILRRRGVATRVVDFRGCRESVDGCNFATAVKLPLPGLGGAEVEFKRGYVAVDALVRGRKYRFANTHLEVREPAPGNPLSRAFQAAQAAELISRLRGDAAQPADRALLLVGDINSAPGDEPPAGAPAIIPPYAQLAAAGFVDAWSTRHGREPRGLTCCQDADLRNRRSKLYERIDVVLAGREPAQVKRAQVVGDGIGDKTHPGPPRLWPSDHAGVAALLRF